MPSFRAKPLAIEAHRIRFEDVYAEEPDTPEWLQEAVDAGEVEFCSGPSQEGCVLIQPDGQRVLVRLGKWVGRSPSGRLFALDDEILADEYELLS